MKKNALPLISICVTVILLVMCLWQTYALKEFQRQAAITIGSLREDHNTRMSDLSARVDELTPEEIRDAQGRPVLRPGYEVEVLYANARSLNVEDWTLETEVSIRLSEVSDFMAVSLLVDINGKTITVPTISEVSDRSHFFDFKFSIPADSRLDVDFTLQVELNDVTILHRLNKVINLSNVMGWRIVSESNWMDYDGGMAYGRCSIGLKAESKTSVLNPYFQLLKNGEVVQTLEAVQSDQWTAGETCEYKAANGQTWSVEAQEGDQIQLRFCCDDGNGIGMTVYLSGREIRDGEVIHLDNFLNRYGFYRAD